MQISLYQSKTEYLDAELSVAFFSLGVISLCLINVSSLLPLKDTVALERGRSSKLNITAGLYRLDYTYMLLHGIICVSGDTPIIGIGGYLPKITMISATSLG